MLRSVLSGLVAAAALSTAAATDFTVADTWTYQQGTGVTIAGPVATSVWHDATTTALKVRLMLLTNIQSTSPATTVLQGISSSSFLSITGASMLGAPVTTGYSVGVAATPALNSASPAVYFTYIDITFDSTAPAGTTYTITYDCTLLRDGPSATANSGSGCSNSPATIRIGWVPVFTLYDISTIASPLDVTGQWVDLSPDTAPALNVAHKLRISVTPGKTLLTSGNMYSTRDTTGATQVLDVHWSATTNPLALTDIFGTGISASDGSENIFDNGATDFSSSNNRAMFAFDTTITYDTSPSAQYVELPLLSMAGYQPGDYIVRIQSNAFQRAVDYAPNAQTVVRIKAGFVMNPYFIETTAFDAADAWFPADKSLALLLAAPTTAAAGGLPAGYALSATTPAYGIGATQLLYGSSSLPGGITSNGGTVPATLPSGVPVGVTLSNPMYKYGLVTSAVSAGTYTFNVAQGVMSITKTNYATIYNARSSKALKIGFKPTMKIVEGTYSGTGTDTRKVVTTNWLNLKAATPTVDPDHAIIITPPTGKTFSAATVTAITVTASSATTAALDTTSFVVSTVAHLALATTLTTATSSAVEAAFTTPTTYTAGSYDIFTPSSSFAYIASDNSIVSSCKTVLTVRAGFGPTVDFDQASDSPLGTVVSSWAGLGATNWYKNSFVNVFLKMTYATGFSDPTGTEWRPSYGIASGNLLYGMPTLPGGMAGSVGSGINVLGSATTGTLSANLQDYYFKLNLASMEPNSYKFTVSNGVLKSGSAYNYEVSATLNIGFELDYDIIDTDYNNMVVGSKRGSVIDGGASPHWMNPNHAHKIIFYPGTFNSAAKTFAAATVAAQPSAVLFDSTPNPDAAVAATAFLTPAFSSIDEGRAVYTYTVPNAASFTAGAYTNYYVPQGTFQREFTLAQNVMQTIPYQIGVEIKARFSTSFNAVSNTVASCDGNAANTVAACTWFDASTIDGTNTNLYMVFEDAASTGLATGSAPTWDQLFPGEKPGAAVVSGGIIGGTPASSPLNSLNSWNYPLTASIISTLPPGQYKFQIPDGAFSLDSTTTYNFATTAYLKIGFPTTVDVVDSNDVSMMASATTSESLNYLRTAFKLRVKVSTAKSNLAVSVYDQVNDPTHTTLAALVASTSLTVTGSNPPTFSGVVNSVSLAADGTSPLYIASYAFSSWASPASAVFTYSANYGTYCTENADVHAQVCNAASVATSLRFGSPTTARIVAASCVAASGTSSTAACAAGDWTQTISSPSRYNIWDADEATVVVMPVFAAAVHLRIHYGSATTFASMSYPATGLDADATAGTVSWAGDIIAPANMPAPSATFTAADNIVEYEWITRAAADTAGTTNVLVPGTYDITIKADRFQNSATASQWNSRVKVRFVVGPQPVFYNMDFTMVAPRDVGGPFSTRANALYLALNGASIQTIALSKILMIKNAADTDVTKSVTITDTPVTHSLGDAISTAAPIYMLGLDGLTDGVYSFIIGGDLADTGDNMLIYNSRALTQTLLLKDAGNANGATAPFTGAAYQASNFATGLKATVIIDRAGPIGNPVTYSGSPVYVGEVSKNIALPTTLFSDAGTPASLLSVTATFDDNKALSLIGTKLSTSVLTTKAAFLRSPAGNVAATIKAVDDAGNSATAVFTVPVVGRSTYSLTAIDARAVQARTPDTLYTGGSASLTATNALALSLVVDFEAPVTNVLVANLQCTVNLGTACSYAVSPTITAAPGNKRFTYQFTIAASQVVNGNTISLNLKMSTGTAPNCLVISTITGAYEVAQATALQVVIDTAKPVAVTYLAPYRATKGTKYTLTLPSKLFYDDVSPAKKIKLVSATPQAQFGLTFTADNQGVATISGIPLAQPPKSSDNRVVFKIVGQDEAGNSGNPVDVIIDILDTFTVTPTLTIKGSLMTFIEKDNDVAADKQIYFDNAATFTAPTGTLFYGIKAYLTRPEDDQLTYKEKLTANSSYTIGVTDAACVDASQTDGLVSAHTCEIAYSVDPLTGEGSIGVQSPTTTAILTATNVQRFIRSLQYYNDRKDVLGANRVIRVDVWRRASITVGERTDANGNLVAGTAVDGSAVAASGSRTLKVVAVNNAPSLSIVTTSIWTEGSGDIAPFSSVGTPVTITDSDDTDFTAAYIQILPTGLTGSYGACDKARDKLYLTPSYMDTAGALGTSPLVVGSWSPASCTLTLTPAGALTKVSNAAMSAAITAVMYTNLDGDNPVNFATDSTLYNRQITVFVEDAANQGKLADKKRNALAATTVNTLTLTPADDAPVVQLRSIFEGGILSSTDKFANIKTTYDDAGLIKIKAFPLLTPAIYNGKGVAVTNDGSSITYTLSFDLTQTKDASGNAIPGSFAKGQIQDVDTALPPALVDVVLVVSGTEVALSDIANAGIDTLYTSVFSSGQWSYSATAPSTLTLNIKNNVPLANLGAIQFKLKFGSASVIFYVDIRQGACLDSSAGRYTASDSTTETYVISRVNADTAGLLTSLTGAATPLTATTALPYLPWFFPDNSLCAYLPTQVVAASGESYTVNRNGYGTLKTALDASVAALVANGASVGSQVAALSDARSAARGAFQVNIPAGSLASRGSMDFSAAKAPADAIALLPALVDKKETVDTAVAVKLQPAGTTFSAPVKVCIFAGDTPDGTYKVLAVAQQKDPGDPTKGYLPWEKLFDQSFNPATGEVCGYTTHFSVFAPVTRPAGVSPTTPKAHLMGGSCPNQCSGHGTCRQEGQCACFPGFEGYDCSMRTCPSAEAWGQDQAVMHTQSECAGRGVCQRETGTCSCFDGFEGAACERAMCPNSCSGHGKCRTLAELPKVQQAGYASWELKRVQKCLCDGGYTGADCSLRICPFGDDPETICSYAQRHVQTLTLDFVTDPTGTGNPDVDLGTDQFAMIFTTASGKNFTTPMIDDIWEGTTDAATNIRNALRTLPEFAIVDVAVSSTPTSAQSLSVSYDITFTGSTNTGDEILMSCPYNSLGSTGCPAPGCRPKFNQLRIFEVPYLPPAVQVSSLAVLQQPKPLGTGVGENDATTPNVFGVESTLVVNKYTVPGTTDLVYTYKFVNTKVYGQSSDLTGVNVATTIEETPVPPTSLRKAVPGPYGLLVDFGTDTQLGIDFSGTGPWTYTFAWRLPTCSVVVKTAAAKDLEKAECSNRGLCNRETGECECFTGYAGYSCSQQTVYV